MEANAWGDAALDCAHAGWAALAAGSSGEETVLDLPLMLLGKRTFTARQCGCAPSGPHPFPHALVLSVVL